METTLQVLMRETPLEVLTRAASLVAGCETISPDAVLGRRCMKRVVSSECELQTNIMSRKCRRVGEQDSPTLTRVSFGDENQDNQNDGGRRSAATQTLFSSFVPFSGFYQLQPTDPVLQDSTVPDEEPCLILDLDQQTVKSSQPCRTTPSVLRNASHASILVMEAECHNSPLNLTTAIPSRRTPGPYHPLAMHSDWHGSSAGHCQGEFVPRGHSVDVANCDIDLVPGWGSEKREHQFVNGVTKIEPSSLSKRTMPYNDLGTNSFAGRNSLRKSGQQETSVRNYTAVETDPNIDEHFRRSLGSDYSRVINRVDIPTQAAAAATTVYQGRTVHTQVETTASSSLSTELSASIAKKSITASGAVDEHFAKSLGSTWTKIKSETAPNSLLINASAVDDHFAKALGETWFRLKAEKRSSPNSSCFV